MANFDLSNLALKAVCPSNEILYDDLGLPSIMVKIPKMTFAQLGLGDSTATFPAFLVNGQEVSEIYISKYLNTVQNGRAYSLPGVGPKHTISLDGAISACSAKGAGWHVLTAFEWGALMLWCEKNNFIPLGNTGYGKDPTESGYKAIPDNKDDTHYALRTLTGTGPATWAHDGTIEGIYDLKGNCWDWIGGIRFVYGELQILTNNNAADSDNPQTATSTLWMAIDATTGALVTPNGSGTTSGTLKLDYQNSKLTWHNAITATQGSAGADTEFSGTFPSITCSSAVADAAKTVLRSLGLLAKEGSIITGSNCYIRPFQAERAVIRGGNYTNSAFGFGSFIAYYPRSFAFGLISFRSAYCKLPD